MAFDVTLHPFNRKEFKYFVEDIVNEPHLIDTRLACIHDKEEERSFLKTAIYKHLPQFKEDVQQEVAHVEKTIGFAGAAILGYLHPFWYLRNGLLSRLMDNTDFVELTANLSSIVDEQNQNLFDSKDGVVENYSSGIYLSFENIQKLLEKLASSKFRTTIEQVIGPENMQSLMSCLKYCISNQLDLLEATDLCVPFSGESSTFSSNMKALHLNNISDFTNFSRKDIPDCFEDLPSPKKIDETWWNNLNEGWQNSIISAYKVKIAPQFWRKFSERDAYVEAKFNKLTLDLSGIDALEEITYSLEHRKMDTLAPLFDFPNLRSLIVGSSVKGSFDLKRLLQFPHLEKLSLGGTAFQNFSSMQELKNLKHLRLGKIDLTTAELKKIKLFSGLKSLFLVFSPYRSINFLQGHTQIQALSLNYTKGLKNFPSLKRLHLFPKETKPTIVNCPNIEFIHCANSRKITDLAWLTHLTKLKTLLITHSHKAVDLSLLSELPNLEVFKVDSSTQLETIPKPIEQIKCVYIGDINEEFKQLTKEKFPNAVLKNFVHPGYY